MEFGCRPSRRHTTPLPIPCRRRRLSRQREVKPHIADDTALVCGKVGRRQFFIRESQSRFPFLLYGVCSSPTAQALLASQACRQASGSQSGLLFLLTSSSLLRLGKTSKLALLSALGALSPFPLPFFCRRLRTPLNKSNEVSIAP